MADPVPETQPAPVPGGAGPTHNPTATVPMRRGLHVSTAATLFFQAPWLLVSLTILGLATGLLSGGQPAVILTVLGAFLATGTLMFTPPVEAAMARFVYHLRRPAPTEWVLLGSAWSVVTSAAGVDGSRFSLWIEDSDEINASAIAGSTVAMTSVATLHLPDHWREGVLAHELGHHVSGHPWALTIMLWYSLPARAALVASLFVIRVVAWVAALVWRTVAGAIRAVMAVAHALDPALAALVRLAVVVAAFGAMLALALPGARLATAIRFEPLLLPPLLVLLTAPLWLAAFSRLAERRADRIAAELGYGPALLEMFLYMIDQGADEHRRLQGRWAYLHSSHPTFRTRFRTLERYLHRARDES